MTAPNLNLSNANGWCFPDCYAVPEFLLYVFGFELLALLILYVMRSRE